MQPLPLKHKGGRRQIQAQAAKVLARVAPLLRLHAHPPKKAQAAARAHMSWQLWLGGSMCP